MLIDNCSAHGNIETLKTEDGKIQAMFIPPNATAAIQPMDQNPIKIAKAKYRNELLVTLIAEEGNIHQMLQKHSINDAIHLLKTSWDAVP